MTSCLFREEGTEPDEASIFPVVRKSQCNFPGDLSDKIGNVVGVLRGYGPCKPFMVFGGSG